MSDNDFDWNLKSYSGFIFKNLSLFNFLKFYLTEEFDMKMISSKDELSDSDSSPKPVYISYSRKGITLEFSVMLKNDYKISVQLIKPKKEPVQIFSNLQKAVNHMLFQSGAPFTYRIKD